MWFGIGFCVLQVLVALVRFGSMDSWNPAELLFVIPAILSGLILFFLGGLLVGLFAQWLVRGSHGAWRTFLLVMIVIATRGSDSNGAKSHVKGRSWDRLASQDLSPSVSQGTIWRYVAVDRRLGYA